MALVAILLFDVCFVAGWCYDCFGVCDLVMGF